MTQLAHAAVRPFDVCGPLPTGTTLLEASAGTGKTFTIAALTARYVAEGVAELSELMLVTFGNAASRELRDRVRERLVSAERGLRDPAVARAAGDDVLRLLATAPDDEVDRRRERLARALAGFDGATIATTHSFCSQMLRGLGTAADTDPGATFTQSLDDLVSEVVHDLYLQTFARPGAAPPTMPLEELAGLGSRAVADSAGRLEPEGAPGPAGRRRAAAQRVREEVERRKRRAGLVDYDDWLVLLRNALADPVHGGSVAERIRSRYRVVLVDEFQDTDPVQWEILRLAFHGVTTLVLIGDPKQSIYAFRGGDVTTYLSAAAVATSQATLARNWRSDEVLLNAFEHLFHGAALGDDRIRVLPVESAHPQPRLTGAGAPLRLRRVPRAGHGSTAQSLPRTDPVREQVAADLAADVVRLLSGPARLRGRPVEPSDIAVLVRANRTGIKVRDALSAAGVPAVLAGGGSVFGTAAAQAWLVLLEAMEQPHRAGRVRGAALSLFLGQTPESLDDEGDALTDRLAPRLRGWAELLGQRGVAAFFEVLTSEESLPARVLALPQGERLLTDVRHVGQALHAVARQESLGLTALVEWLRRRIAQSAVENSDERSRRLESDAAAVQVMTVHVSKGLEFPVVYVPSGWDRWTPDDPDLLRLHDEQGRRVLHVGGKAAPDYREALARHEAEEAGEELRLLYVALTRAACQVVAWWAPTPNTASAPLHRLLFGGPEVAARVLPPRDDEAAARLDEVAAASQGTIAHEVVQPVPAVRWEPVREPAQVLSTRTFSRRLDTAWRRTSYSALTAAAHEAASRADYGPATGAADSEPDEPGTADEPVALPADDAQVPDGSPVSPLAAFPGGTSFGTLVHEVLEDLDPAALQERCAEAVARRPGTRVDPVELAAGLLPVLHTPLGGWPTSLGAVPAADRLPELGFELPLAGGDAALAHRTLRDAAALLRRHDLGALAPYPDLLDGLEPAALRGFLTGSIDALLRLPGPDGRPRHVVVDYKTNRLGTDPLTAWHYRAEAMTEEMLRAHYPLQALLYAVAVHRFLRWRLPGYDPEVHLGGVLYLFVRGMCGPDSPPGAGVFEWHPPAALVTDLSDLLAGAG